MPDNRPIFELEPATQTSNNSQFKFDTKISNIFNRNEVNDKAVRFGSNCFSTSKIFKTYKYSNNCCILRTYSNHTYIIFYIQCGQKVGHIDAAAFTIM